MIPPGTILRNRYQIIKELGKGGFGDTYLAKDLDLPKNPHCVVKHLQPKNNTLAFARGLFNIEAEVLNNLGKQSPQIPTLFAHIEENGEFYLVQEFIDGHDLTKEIIFGKKLSESYVISLLQSILEVLTVAHEYQPNAVIHRDIKPPNLMRHKDGKIILIDFGAVKEINQLIVNANGSVTTTVVIGTPGYMPSEQAKGKPKLCSDVYAVGMIGIQALTGIPPHKLPEDSTTGEVSWRHLVPRVDAELGKVLDKMVRDNFSKRYQNAREALQAILFLSSNTSGSQVPTIPVIPQHSRHLTTKKIQTNTTRRGLLQFAGFAGGSFVISALISQSLLNNNSSSSSPSSNNEPPSPESSPKKSSPKTTAKNPSPQASPEPIAESPAPKPSPKPSPETPAPKASSNSLKTFDFETVTVNSTGQIANRSQGQARVFTDNLGDGITIDMIAIPGGSFVMGSPSTESGRSDNEGQQRTVTVAPFFMGKYEVTQAQYQAVMGNNPSRFKGAKRPVEQVSWNEAVEFCRKLTQKTGKSYRLPSEAEWEYACRAGTTTPFYFGDTITPDLVNYDGNYPYGAAPKGLYRQQTTDVGSFPPNSFGLYDMHGNVWEWCSDKYHGNYSGAPTDGSS
ncbi:MAG: hypothetical protein EAZ18_25495, partial [Oscillatoriales cyanobacterium]